jgi:hypothetical protein
MTDDRPKSAGRRRKRRWPAILAGVVGVLFVACAALYLASPGLVARQAETWLAAHGAPDADVDIASLGLGGATVARVNLGATRDDLALEHVDIDYRLNGFAMPTIERVVVRDLQLAIDPADKARPLGILSDVIAAIQAGADGSSPGLDTIPPVTIEHATLSVPSYLGGASVKLSGDILPDGPQNLTADLVFEAKSNIANLTGRLRVDCDLDATGSGRLIVENGRVLYNGPPAVEIPTISGWANFAFENAQPISAEIEVKAPDVVAAGWPGASLTLEGSYEADLWSALLATNGSAAGLEGWITAAGAATGEGQTDLATELTLEAGAPWWSLLGLPTPSRGTMAVKGDVWIDPDAAILADGSRGPSGAGSLQLRTTDLAIENRIAELSGTAEFDVAASPLGWTVRSQAPLLATGRPEQGLLDRISLPANPVLAGEPVSIEATDLTLSGNMNADQGRTIRAEGSIDVTGGTTIAINTSLVATLDTVGNIASIDVETLAVNVGALSWKEGLRTIAIDGATLEGNANMSGRNCAASFAVSADLAGSDFGEFTARDGSAAFPADLQCNAERIELRTTGEGTIRLKRLQVSGTPYVVDQATFRIESGAAIVMPRVCTTPPCDATFTFDGTLAAVSGRTDPDGQSFAMEPARVSFDGAMTQEGAFTGALDFSSAQLALNDGEMAADDIDAHITFEPGAPASFSVDVAQIRNSSMSEWVPALSATATGTVAPEAAKFAVHFVDGQNAIEFDVTGSHSFADGTGSAEIDMPPIQFRPGGLQPWDLFPPLAKDIDEATGRVALDGSIAWNDTGVQSDLALRLEELSLTTPQADLARINGLVELQSISPLLSKPDQRVSVALIDIGIPLTDAVVTFAIEPGPRIAIANAHLELADGTVDAAPVTIDPQDTDALIELAVANMDLSEFLALAAVEGLVATGRLDGTIPVEIRDADIVITGARLDARGPGTLSYAPATPPAGLQGAGETASLVLAALANFQYETLWLTLNRQPGGETGLGLHVRGSNPDFFDGYPIEFNLNLTGELDRILRDSLVGYRIPDIVQERLESGETTVTPSEEGEEQ